jgi:DNA primase
VSNWSYFDAVGMAAGIRLGAATAGLHYLKDRGLDASTISYWGLGYFDDVASSAVRSFIPPDQEDWLGVHGINQRLFYRITIPLRDPVGRVIGFVGRALPGSPTDGVRYLYPPPNHILELRSNLLGLHNITNQFFNDVLSPAVPICVEGPFDAICGQSLAQLPTLCTHKANITIEQALLLRAINPDRCIVMPDADDGGEGRANYINSVTRHRRFLPREVLLVDLPEGKDPASLAAEDPLLLRNLSKTGTPIR